MTMRLRSWARYRQPPGHGGTIVTIRAQMNTRGGPGFLLLRKAGRNITARAHDTTTTITTTTAGRPARRSDAGSIRLTQRDIDGLMLAGEHSGVPADLLAAALRVQPAG